MAYPDGDFFGSQAKSTAMDFRDLRRTSHVRPFRSFACLPITVSNVSVTCRSAKNRVEGLLLDPANYHIISVSWKKLINGKPLPDAYIFVTNAPWHHHLLDQNSRCEFLIEGFQIRDFKGDVPSPSLRAAIDAREKHIEMHELLSSLQDHMDVPVTFDGEIPEFAFGNSQPRLLIGHRYPTKDENGVERIGTTVVEKDKLVWGVLLLDDGNSVMTTWPLSDAELEAWRCHPDTFFGKVEQRKHQVTTLLELYDFFFSSYIHNPRERLLEMLDGAPDIEELRSKDQPALASIYAERTALSAWASKPPVPPREALFA